MELQEMRLPPGGVIGERLYSQEPGNISEPYADSRTPAAGRAAPGKYIQRDDPQSALV